MRELKFSPGLRKVAVWTIIASFLILFNPQNLSTDYGTGNGKYPDRVDSFSEFIVRNTVTYNTIENKPYTILPILTEGYYIDGVMDYTYSGDNVVQYASNLAFQTVPMSVAARILNLEKQEDFKAYFSGLRVIQAIALSFFLMVFAYCFVRFFSLRGGWIMPLAVGTSVGFVLFAQNLYFLAPLMVAPAAMIAFQMHRSGKWNVFAVFALSLANFLRGYEFLSVSALLTTLAAMIFINGEWRPRLVAGAKAMTISILAFFTALAVQISVIALNSTTPVSVFDAILKILNRAKVRNLSTEGVPSPLGNEFFYTLMHEWLEPAFKLVDDFPSLSKFSILIALFLIFAARMGHLTKADVTIFLYGFVGYASWYIFGYQHIMHHRTYDKYIFALTIGISATLLAVFALDRFLRRWDGFAETFLNRGLTPAGPSPRNSPSTVPEQTPQ